MYFWIKFVHILQKAGWVRMTLSSKYQRSVSDFWFPVLITYVQKKGEQPKKGGGGQDLHLQLKCRPRELRDQNLYPTLHISLFHLWEPDIKDKDIQKQYVGEIRKSLGICRKRHRSWEHLNNLKFLPHDCAQDSGSLKQLFNKRETKPSKF